MASFGTNVRDDVTHQRKVRCDRLTNSKTVNESDKTNVLLVIRLFVRAEHMSSTTSVRDFGTHVRCCPL